jgi:hypothetical protein
MVDLPLLLLLMLVLRRIIIITMTGDYKHWGRRRRLGYYNSQR